VLLRAFRTLRASSFRSEIHYFQQVGSKFGIMTGVVTFKPHFRYIVPSREAGIRIREPQRKDELTVKTGSF
jgi:hypothetical protein